jgi:hypothetical protein
MNSLFDKKSSYKYISGIVSGLALSFIFSKLRKKLKTKSMPENEEIDIETQKKMLLEKDEIALLKEQLKRNFEFFGEDGMNLISNSFAVVVGIGGVGR